MDYIIFADGEKHVCTFCASIPDGTAYIAVNDTDFAGAAALFSNPEKTKVMYYGDIVLDGFTTCVMLGVQPYGFQAVLKGGTIKEKGSEANIT